MALLICAAASSRRAFSSAASSSTIVCPGLSLSPSWAKIFSTRPPLRGPTCTSSTSIVPETALFWRWHPAKKASATSNVAGKIFEKKDRAEFANMERIDRSKVARHDVPETLGKEMAGYSGTPLAQKLGIKPGQKVITLNAPAGYPKLLAPLPEAVLFARQATAGADFVHQ